MLRTQLIIYAILILLCIPVYFLDHYSLKSSGGNWISLDFSHLLFRAYILFIIIYIIIITLMVILYPHNKLGKIHLFSFVISLVFISVGFFIYNRYEDYNYNKERVAKSESHKIFFNDIRIIRWWFVPDATHPTEIHVDLKVAAAGRFEGNAMGKEIGETVDNIFTSDGEEQRVVKAGDSIHYVFPLKFNHRGQADNIEFTFYLFKHPPGESGDDDVSKIFQNHIVKNANSSNFYEKLVPPLDQIPE